ncbi:unnamed protein product [Linum trigynum]|uniref:Uncharacterized protein n=1 Tax=Linum trigynum TaxID=586398 RepID=A0AAV2CGK8_9ROSI
MPRTRVSSDASVARVVANLDVTPLFLPPDVASGRNADRRAFCPSCAINEEIRLTHASSGSYLRRVSAFLSAAIGVSIYGEESSSSSALDLVPPSPGTATETVANLRVPRAIRRSSDGFFSPLVSTSIGAADEHRASCAVGCSRDTPKQPITASSTFVNFSFFLYH